MGFVQLKYEAQELDELREMKADIERRDKAQALLIENQAKRLDELETLYKVGEIVRILSKCLLILFLWQASSKTGR